MCLPNFLVPLPRITLYPELIQQGELILQSSMNDVQKIEVKP
jgi:hypothetical protein